MGCLKTTRVYSLTISESGSLKARCQQGESWVSESKVGSGGQGRIIPCLSPSFWWLSLARGHIMTLTYSKSVGPQFGSIRWFPVIDSGYAFLAGKSQKDRCVLSASYHPNRWHAMSICSFILPFFYLVIDTRVSLLLSGLWSIAIIPYSEAQLFPVWIAVALWAWPGPFFVSLPFFNYFLNFRAQDIALFIQAYIVLFESQPWNQPFFWGDLVRFSGE